MALYMFFHPLPDQHVEFLREHPDTFRAYMSGEQPEPRRSFLDKLLGREVALDLPSQWPQGELDGFCPEVNHRQVEYFHYILNGSNDKVGHAGCVFQTWFAPRFDSVAVTIDGENFALMSRDVPDLKARIETVSESELLTRYEQAVGEPDASEEDQEFLTHAFSQIRAACDEAIQSGHGLMWTAG